MAGRTCRHCSAPLRRKSKNGPWPRYCNATCRAAHHRAQNPDLAASYIAAGRARLSERRAEARRQIVVECPCGAAFCPMPGRTGKVPMYCSPLCRNRAFSERRRSTPEGKARLNDYQRARVARTKGDADAKPFTAADIYERDGWVCGLCHDPIDPRLSKRDPKSASLDHVIPLSLGGEHSPENTQAAHLVCNGRKGNRVAA